jgi:large subunit ribosomal protein L24
MVQVISGDDKGTRARILSVDRKNDMIVVEGVNRVKKHVRPSKKAPQGGVLSKEMPVPVSIVMLLDPQTGRPTRLGVRYLPDGSKELYAKKSGATIRLLSKPRPAYAAKTAQG